MKQVVVKKGHVITDTIPIPTVEAGEVLVKLSYSCISAGTEIMGISQSGKSVLQKAMEQPQKVKQAMDMLSANGVQSVFRKVEALEEEKPLGYSAAGIVVEVGSKITDIKVGDRVAVAGAGYANHAEIVAVPRNLTMKIPEGVDEMEASTVTMGGIAMQGVRRLKPELGEIVAVVGLGLLGQLAVQMLVHCGCHVIGIDLNRSRLNMAKSNGCELVLSSVTGNDELQIRTFTCEKGVDAVLIAAATNSETLLDQCFQLCRRKGRVVLLGVVGCKFNRESMYSKELDFYISTSYGPGRYDNDYEEKGIDYPYAYVRWTENRNMVEYLNMLSLRRISVMSMIGKIFPVEDASKAYEYLILAEDKPLISLIKYDRSFEEIKLESEHELTNLTGNAKEREIINIAVIGAGGFAKVTHLPNLASLNSMYHIRAIVTNTGTNGKNISEQYHADYYTSDFTKVLEDPMIDAVLICTRHNLHAKMACLALKHNKSVFLEKPLALTETELSQVLEALQHSTGCFMIGYNRRYSPIMQTVKDELKGRISPAIINYQMNAGYIPMDSWIQTEEGGGRIIGELCHIIDLCSFLLEQPVTGISVNSIKPDKALSARDNVVITLSYKDGSLANLVYTAIGDLRSGKEFCDIYCDRKTIRMSDYKSLTGYGTKLKNINVKRQDKGHLNELKVFHNAVKEGNRYPIPLDDLIQTSKITFLAEQEVCRSSS